MFFGSIVLFGQSDKKTIASVIAKIEEHKILDLSWSDTLFVSVRDYNLKIDKRYFIFQGKVRSTKNKNVCDSNKNLNYCLNLYFNKDKSETNHIEFTLMNYSLYNGSFDVKIVDGEFVIMNSKFIKSDE